MAAPMSKAPGYQAPTRLRGVARALALELAAEARTEWGYTSDLIASTFRKNRQLGSHDRRLVSETVYGLVRWDRRLDAIVDEMLGKRRERREEPTPVARAELKLLVYEIRQGLPAEAASEDFRRLLRGVPDGEALRAEDAGLGHRTGLDREAVRRSFPTWLIERFVADLGEE